MQINTRFLSKNIALLSLALIVSMTGGVLAGCQNDMGTEETEENMEEESMDEEESMEEEESM
ncbi:MAG: hypothetical protein ACLFM2_10160, partial [Halothece sp.]